MSSENPILIEDNGSFVRLRINRPEKRNAMNGAARAGLRNALREVQNHYRVVVISGAGDVFCSGMDLKENASDPAARVAASNEWVQTLLDIRNHPAIVISSVNGLALGGGLSLVNVSDLAIAADEAEMGMPEMGFATYPGMAGPSTQLMLPPKRAAWMVLTAKRIKGQVAEQWGLVNQSVPLANLEEATNALASHIGQFDAVALAESKKALEMVPKHINDWPAAFEQGRIVNTLIRARSTSQSEGLAKFARGEKNPGQGKD